MKKILLFASLFLAIGLSAQSDRWQQHALYDMDIEMDVETNRFTGTQEIKYTNNSPDELDRIFYHLFYNAFQPGSMMDERSRTIADPDKRVGDRISKLSENEIGYQKVKTLTMNGKECKFYTEGTILEVDLPTAIKPGQTVKLEMTFEAQVPLQIRRTGRDNKEGIRYSMTQWFPKLCEYDYQGWHANPYVGREFHGIWGDFDVKITIDKKYLVGASGQLQNANKIGMGYTDKQKGKLSLKKKRTWHFVAKNVHDFAWAADPDYTHLVKEAKDGTELHYMYQKTPKTEENWEKLHEAMSTALPFINENFGEYPYPVYYFLQGGDGGMEYAMCTLIRGERSFERLVGVSVHELMHSWYQMILGTNEALYPWMDEGFTTYASAQVMNYLRQEGVLDGEVQRDPMYNNVRSFAGFTQSGMEEALITHSDHYGTNTAYGAGSYTKGSVFLQQLKYIVGEKSFKSGMLRYFDEWKFKHPNPNDFIRVMEKESGLELDWFREYFVNTTHTIDYAIEGAEDLDGKAVVSLKKIGKMPMPIDVLVVKENGNEELYHIPLRIMRGEKKDEGFFDAYRVAKDWPWTHENYELYLDVPMAKIKSIIIDPTSRMVDINNENNVYPQIQP